MSWKLSGLTAALLMAVVVVARVAFEDTTATWDIGRAAGFTTYTLLWAAVFTGAGVDMRFHPGIRRQAVVFEIHRMTGTLGLAFLLGHVLATLVDPFLSFTVADALVGVTSGYEALGMTLGVVAQYLLIAVLVATWGAGYLNKGSWYRLHLLSYPAFVIALVHALLAGSNTMDWPTHVFYSATAGSALGAIVLRAVGTGWITQPHHPSTDSH